MVTVYANGRFTPGRAYSEMPAVRATRNEALDRSRFETLEDLVGHAEVDHLAEFVRYVTRALSRRQGDLLAMGYTHHGKAIEIAARILAAERLKVTNADLELVDVASDHIRRVYKCKWHHIAAAALGVSGRVYISSNLGTSIPINGTCAERIILGEAQGRDDRVKTVVAVKFIPEDETLRIVPPCGGCTQALLDYGVEEVILQEGGRVYKLAPNCLQTAPYV